MLVFLLKQMFSLKQAILGRREPHQLAWGLALGVLLGIVPHGNLIALAILLFILSLRVNHGMVAVTAVATSLLAAMLDAHTHAVGKYLLTHPDFAPQLAAAWQWPVMPWTDLNNTVVMGSLMIGMAALLPTYLFSYPIFHALAPGTHDLPAEDLQPPPRSGPMGSALQPVRQSNTVGSSRRSYAREQEGLALESEQAAIIPIFHPLAETDTSAVDAAFEDVARAEQAARQVTVDTRIEVVRISDLTAAGSAAVREGESPAGPQDVAGDAAQPDQPMSEALNYLLRQLRDSRQGRAA